MPIFAGKLTNLAVGAVALPEHQLEGGYQVFDDIAERDSFTSSTDGATVGMLSAVRTLPYIYRWSGTGWVKILTVGNTSQTFIDEMNSQILGAERYISATGDDEADGLTPATAWATGQRAVDEIPDIPEIGAVGFGATIYLLHVDSGAPPPLRVDFHNLGGTLWLLEHPDFLNMTPAASFAPTGVGVKPLSPDPLTTTNTLNAQHAYAVTPGSFPALTDGSHCLWATNGSNFGSCFTLDGTFSDDVVGDLRVLGSFEVASFYSTVDLFPLDIELGPNVDPTAAFPGLEIVDSSTSRVNFWVQGFLVPPTINSTRYSGVNWTGSFINSGQIRPFLTCDANGSQGAVFGNHAFYTKVGTLEGDFGHVTGLFTAGVTVFSGYAIGQTSMMIRGGQLAIGGIFSTALSPIISMDIGNVDFDGQGGGNVGLTVSHGARVRTSESSRNLNFIDVSRAILVNFAGYLTVGGGRIFGSQRAPSRLLNPYSTALGLANASAQVDGLENSVDPGHNILLQNLPSPNADGSWDWTDLPKTDASLGDTSSFQVCR